MYPSLFELLVRNGVDRDTAHRVIARVCHEVRSGRPADPVVRLLRATRGGVAPVFGRLPGSAVQLYTVAQAAEARGHFPYPVDRFGDVPNRDAAPGGNDSTWLDLGCPVLVSAGGDAVWAPVSPLELRALTRKVLDWR